MKNKFLSLAAIFALGVSFTGCGGGSSTQSDNSTPSVVTSFDGIFNGTTLYDYGNSTYGQYDCGGSSNAFTMNINNGEITGEVSDYENSQITGISVDKNGEISGSTDDGTVWNGNIDSNGNMTGTWSYSDPYGTCNGTFSGTGQMEPNDKEVEADSFAYSTITSAVTGKVWLDRNLGASRACLYKDDSECYGDYYQWGRDADGHEKQDSSITYIQATTLTPGHGDFINEDDWTTADRDKEIRMANWNPCPSGFRVPTLEDIEAENMTNAHDAFNLLKLPISGYRVNYDPFDPIKDQGLNSRIWTIDYKDHNIVIFTYNDENFYGSYSAMGHGHTIRCIKN